MRVVLEMAGDSPLLMHNARLSDPLDSIVRSMKPAQSKRKKTEEDHNYIAEREFLGGLYMGPDGPVIPASNIRACLIEAAKLSRLGTTLMRALTALQLQFKLIYDGPKTEEKLWKDVNFRLRESVRVGQQRVMRTRPMFRKWQLKSIWELDTDVLNFDDFVRVAADAGVYIGLCDRRTLGNGRFKAEVRVAKPEDER